MAFYCTCFFQKKGNQKKKKKKDWITAFWHKMGPNRLKCQFQWVAFEESRIKDYLWGWFGSNCLRSVLSQKIETKKKPSPQLLPVFSHIWGLNIKLRLLSFMLSEVEKSMRHVLLCADSCLTTVQFSLLISAHTPGLHLTLIQSGQNPSLYMCMRATWADAYALGSSFNWFAL